MLVLNRMPGESCIIVVPPSSVEQRIKVTAIDMRMRRLRIGFEAPATVVIHRTEVMDRIELEGK